MQTNTVSLSEARKNLSRLVSEVSTSKNDAYRIAVRGKDVAVLLSSDAFASLMRIKYGKEFDEIFDMLDDFNKAMVNK